MIDLYTWATLNGRKVSIMLEECALPYEVIAVDITTGSNPRPSSQRSIQTARFR